jgi:hypothetical protein
MNAKQKPTAEQAEIIRRARLDPDTVTVATKSAALPLPITYHGDGKPLHYWIVREAGTLRLSDTKPTTAKPRQQDGEPTDKADTIEEPEQPAHNPDKLKAALRRQGFSEQTARAMVAQVCDDDTIRAAAAKFRLTRGQLANPKCQNIVKALRSRKALPIVKALTTQPTPAEPGTLPGLLAALCDILDDERGAAWEYCGLEAEPLHPKATPRHVFRLQTKLRTVTHTYPTEAFARKIVACVREYPATLTHGKGLNWPAKLAEIITAAKCGSKTERIEARRALQLFTGRQGNAVEYAGHPVRVAFATLCGRLAALQREYLATVCSGTIKERLAALQQRHPGELNGFAPDELQRILTRKTLAVAGELAASATSTSADFWGDVYKREAGEIERAISGIDPCKCHSRKTKTETIYPPARFARTRNHWRTK